MAAPVKYRIGQFEAASLVTFAAVFDALSVIPGAGLITTPIAQGGLALFFFMSGVNVFGGKTVLPFLGTSFIELFPVLDAFPTLIVETVFIIAMSRIEDRLAASKNPASQRRS